MVPHDGFVSVADDACGQKIMITAIATAGKFLLGLWLALLLNHHIPFKAFIRAIVLLPFIDAARLLNARHEASQHGLPQEVLGTGSAWSRAWTTL